ncbi:MAG: phytoene/squalene synthase family protein [Gordonia sp. (in: high G+C Gram-positive bacteria)]
MNAPELRRTSRGTPAGDAARGYLLARSMTAHAGRTYYLASGLLPRADRRAMFALYGFARTVDDVVDGPADPAAKAAAVDLLEDGLRTALSCAPAAPVPPAELVEAFGPSTGTGVGPADPAYEPTRRTLTADQLDLLAALADTVRRYRIPTSTFDDFLTSMRMDIEGSPRFRNRYRTFSELAAYTRGSAAVIGVQMLPILGIPSGTASPVDGTPYEELERGAALLGDAFQLTNFLRDVADDLARDRIYLPLDVLEAFGVDEANLRRDLLGGSPSPELRRAIAHLISVNRDQYRCAAPAVAALPRRTRPAIAAAATSYGDILTEIERSGYDVVSRRAVVPRRRRIAHAAAAAVGLRALP